MVVDAQVQAEISNLTRPLASPDSMEQQGRRIDSVSKVLQLLCTSTTTSLAM